jgi:hypothetical protein
MSHCITRPDVFRDPKHGALPAPPMAMALLWSRTDMKEVWHVVQAIRGWRGVAIETDCTGLSFMVGGAALGHLRWNGRLDLPFVAEIEDRLVAEEMVSRDPDQPGTGGVVFDVRTLTDVDRAVWLLRLAYLTVESGYAPAQLTSRTLPRDTDDNCVEIAFASSFGERKEVK